MTPMIDIVFQLIIFFMLTLKFKEIDRRIDSALPKDRGMAATSDFPEEFEKIKIKVFRRNLKEAEAEHYTLIKIDNTHRVELPAGTWKGGRADDAIRHEAYDVAMARIRAAVSEKVALFKNDPELYCEIVSPMPDGGAVPEGDVIGLVDMLVQLEVKDIRFEGASMPGGVLGNR